MVGITGDRLGSYPHELSGGMRQRVHDRDGAWRLEPQVVIMDEPTTALDVVTQREILEELIRLRDELGFAVLFITHDLSLLIELADEIAVMYAGRLVERARSAVAVPGATPPLHLRAAQLVPADARGAEGDDRHRRDSPPDLRSIPSGCAFHPRCLHAMERCAVDVPALVAAGGRPPVPRGRSPREVACWLQTRSPLLVPDRATPDQPSR